MKEYPAIVGVGWDSILMGQLLYGVKSPNVGYPVLNRLPEVLGERP